MNKYLILIVLTALIAFTSGCAMSKAALEGTRATIHAGVDSALNTAITVVDVADSLKNTVTKGAKDTADTAAK